MKKEKKSKRTNKTGEMETLAQFYSETVIQKAIKRKTDKEIARRNKKEGKRFAEKYKVNIKEKEKKEMYVLRIIERDGTINEQGISKKDYLNDDILGYKIKKISKSYEVPEGVNPFISVEHKDTRTDEQKEEDNRRIKIREDKEKKDKGDKSMELV